MKQFLNKLEKMMSEAKQSPPNGCTVEKSAPYRVAVVGAGAYGLGLICQLEAVKDLEASIVADQKPGRAMEAFQMAGVASEDIVTATCSAEVSEALQRGRRVAVTDASLVPDADVNILVDCTGSVEAGARLALEGIAAGKHIVEVNVEMDSVVGPILSHLACDNGVVYTLADGDQPSLLTGLVKWVQSLGLRVVVAGKGTCMYEGEELRRRLGKTRGKLTTTAFLDGTKSQIEMACTCNATGLGLDVTGFHRPRFSLEEAVEGFALSKDGGILKTEGVVDFVNCVGNDGSSLSEERLAHGVFVVATADNAHSLQLMRSKGLSTSSDGKRVLIYRPHHLCGIETVTSVRYACQMGLATARPTGKPQVDVVAVAKRDLAPGSYLGGIGNQEVKGVAFPAQEVIDNGFLPVGLADGVKLKQGVSRGTPITRYHLEGPRDSLLWKLRDYQDRLFFEQ